MIFRRISPVNDAEVAALAACDRAKLPSKSLLKTRKKIDDIIQDVPFLTRFQNAPKKFFESQRNEQAFYQISTRTDKRAVSKLPAAIKIETVHCGARSKNYSDVHGPSKNMSSASVS